MPKFKIIQAVRIDGKHVEAGTELELDARIQKDHAKIQILLGSNRFADPAAVHKHLDEAAKGIPAAPAEASNK